MIGQQPGVKTRVKARPVDEHGHLASGGFMELLYDPREPWEVQLAGLPDGPATFGRELLSDALKGDAGGEGDVHVRHAILAGVPHSLLIITVQLEDGPLQVALTAAKVMAFLQDTEQQVAPGQEQAIDFIADVELFLGKVA